MDPAPARNARRVQWVSFSQGEAKSGLPFMKAIVRNGSIVQWSLSSVASLMDKKRPGWLGQRGIRSGTGDIQEEFGLSEDYPWLIGSRRVVQIQRRKHIADGGSPLASSEAYSEQFFCASSAGLLALLLDRETNCYSAHKQTAAHLLQD